VGNPSSVSRRRHLPGEGRDSGTPLARQRQRFHRRRRAAASLHLEAEVKMRAEIVAEQGP
jgi:hypothetical protein